MPSCWATEDGEWPCSSSVTTTSRGSGPWRLCWPDAGARPRLGRGWPVAARSGERCRADGQLISGSRGGGPGGSGLALTGPVVAAVGTARQPLAILAGQVAFAVGDRSPPRLLRRQSSRAASSRRWQAARSSSGYLRARRRSARPRARVASTSRWALRLRRRRGSCVGWQVVHTYLQPLSHRAPTDAAPATRAVAAGPVDHRERSRVWRGNDGRRGANRLPGPL
jgi:hypothetical protein